MNRKQINHRSFTKSLLSKGQAEATTLDSPKIHSFHSGQSRFSHLKLGFLQKKTLRSSEGSGPEIGYPWPQNAQWSWSRHRMAVGCSAWMSSCPSYISVRPWYSILNINFFVSPICKSLKIRSLLQKKNVL